MTLKETLQIAGCTDPGRTRARNEDAIGEDAELGLMVLADGMGGHSGGDVASRIAVDTIIAELRQSLARAGGGQGESNDEISLQVREAVIQANRAIHEAAADNVGNAGMGTTLAVALLRPGRIILAHVGDSRIYRFRNGELEQLTVDHTLIQELVDRGLCSADQARTSLNRNLVTRALGIDSTVAVDIREELVMPGDIYLLCSDGLNDMLEDAMIEDVLGRHQADPHEASRELVRHANESGGRDNVSVLIGRTSLASRTRGRWYHRLLGLRR
ncbi:MULTISPECIES: Stp1/IreP family PP2C-type Ser/Thr phosphatase [Ectothiorhodospira]|uniref:Stp1/IreP family PP2C-type Ser/Thr phosphatase n=1 Tax=Ectothiorhodospira TaxID=1051 RepID=UPI001EE7CAF5|nr:MULTISPECIES: Stp1/IreP family PP2C-type Ser/Thr phosphatase [Ectothiorhodospira]MCG5493221.1 Stp1/IreP family PP2C-type Ser/Thr phosphatase [Ectothiorhodospira variabilis]MCG5497057.1 Stp1/IreP family PP2C-type Ser/Thr phosphatase [Ectothiorhodospira variabilis]MCG5502550.1 Stp1/IreP family PP2C-type Ser/Thr phosphatase [Ectothiorhodospira variabilis]MCG5505684.1 Stp1/IreP family PP2C-type Ser/Thr phosphatase [Ectothiorhodospira variabilis]MCG5525409.1 Stp1/IreP family PP2C-type Ser/Thr ph